MASWFIELCLRFSVSRVATNGDKTSVWMQYKGKSKLQIGSFAWITRSHETQLWQTLWINLHPWSCTGHISRCVSRESRDILQQRHVCRPSGSELDHIQSYRCLKIMILCCDSTRLLGSLCHLTKCSHFPSSKNPSLNNPLGRITLFRTANITLIQDSMPFILVLGFWSFQGRSHPPLSLSLG